MPDKVFKWLCAMFQLKPRTFCPFVTAVLAAGGYGTLTTILQPLDLSCFLPLKSRYRMEISKLTRFDGSAPVKKIQLIRFYELACNESLIEYKIKAGWKPAGIYPWDPRKIIRSAQL
jgi:hypothetical protein